MEINIKGKLLVSLANNGKSVNVLTTSKHTKSVVFDTDDIDKVAKLLIKNGVNHIYDSYYAYNDDGTKKIVVRLYIECV